MLRRNPAFTAIAVLSLALAIGANTGVFALLNAVVLRELDVRRSEQLVSVTTLRRDGVEGGLSFPMFEEVSRRQRVFSTLIAHHGGGIFNVAANGAIYRLDLWPVSGNFYSDLGITPHIGRLIEERDDNLSARTAEMVVVLGYGVWQREFGGDASVVGRTLKIEGVPFTIIGVGPKGFTAFGITSEADVAIPLSAYPLVTATHVPGPPMQRFSDRKSRWVDVVGRLRDGVSLEEARAQLTTEWPAIVRDTTPSGLDAAQLDEFNATRLAVTSAARGQDFFLRTRFTRPLYVVLAVAGMMLLIACVNLASLMLSRVAAHRHELSIRMALGASRWRMARQILAEGLLLSSIGAGGGVLFAAWTSEAIKSIMTRDYFVPSVLRVSPDGRVLAFASAVAVLAGILCSVLPAWWATRPQCGEALRGSSRSAAGTGRTGKTLIVVEVALSLVLLTDSALLVRTLQQLRSTDFGFRTEAVTMAQLFPRPDAYTNLDDARYYPDLIGRIAALPGVRDAALFRTPPGLESKQRVVPAEASGSEVTAVLGIVGPQFFRTIDIPLVRGRDVAWSDAAHSTHVAIVSRSLAARMFPHEDAIGRRIRLRDTPEAGELEIVGVVGDVRFANPRSPSPYAVYLAILQHEYSGRWGEVLVRGAGGRVPEADVRRAVASAGREQVTMYRTLGQVTDRTIVQERVTAMIAGFFGVLALALCAIGLYGLMAYAVTQRTRELGIRMALGAERRGVLAMTVRETMMLVAIGLATGLPLALMAGRVVSGLLFGLTPTDPVSLGATVLLLLGVGLLAGYLPGRRASRVEPMVALRHQ